MLPQTDFPGGAFQEGNKLLMLHPETGRTDCTVEIVHPREHKEMYHRQVRRVRQY